MNILGISCGHDANVCVINDEKILIHLEKERFTRNKHDTGNVDNLILRALSTIGLQLDDIDVVATSIPVWPKYGCSGKVLSGDIYKNLFEYSNHTISLLGKEIPAIFIPHHVGHMAYSYYLSGFKSADIISVDAYGNFTATSIGIGEGRELYPLYNLYPSNIGSLWCIVSRKIFGSLFDAGKTMGLASFGEPKYLDRLKQRYLKQKDGWLILDDPWVDNENFPILDKLGNKFDVMHSIARDMASSIQMLTNEIMWEYAQEAQRRSGNRFLCLAGGVALNGVANEMIIRSGIYDDVFVGPATNDAGLSIGFSLFTLHHVFGEPRRDYSDHVYLSEFYDNKEIEITLSRYRDQLRIDKVPNAQLVDITAELLYDGAIVGWFQGRAESGPRALGHRSILCNPAINHMKDMLNSRVKHRESFRPFAPSVLDEDKNNYFELQSKSPYMLRIVSVEPTYRSQIPAIVHVDGSTRPQTVTQQNVRIYYDLLKEFGRKTGIPVLLNTSFNIRGEPIVESPDDAIKCFLSTEIDYLIIENWLICKKG